MTIDFNKISLIIIYHNNSKVIALSNAGSYSIDKAKNLTIVEFLLLLAKEYQNDLLVWCHINLKEQLILQHLISYFIIKSYYFLITHLIRTILIK